MMDDFGLRTQKELFDKSEKLFGVNKPIEASSTVSLDAAAALADPTNLVTVAKGLKVHVVAAGASDDVGPNSDQMVLWPPAPHSAQLSALSRSTGISRPGAQRR